MEIFLFDDAKITLFSGITNKLLLFFRIFNVPRAFLLVSSNHHSLSEDEQLPSKATAYSQPLNIRPEFCLSTLSNRT